MAVHVAGLAADVGFIYFDLAIQLAAVVALHGQANPVIHEPAGFLGDAERARQFIARNAVLAVGDHPGRQHPVLEGKRRILENRADLGRKLGAGMLLTALETTLIGEPEHVGTAASRASHFAVRPRVWTR